MRRKLAGMPGGAHPPGPAHALRQRDRECRVQEARRERQAAAAGGRGCLAMRPRRGAAGIHLGWGAAAAGVQPRAEGAAVAWGVRRGALGGCGRRRGGRRQGTRPLGVALVRVAPAPPRVLALAGRALRSGRTAAAATAAATQPRAGRLPTRPDARVPRAAQRPGAARRAHARPPAADALRRGRPPALLPGAHKRRLPARAPTPERWRRRQRRCWSPCCAHACIARATAPLPGVRRTRRPTTVPRPAAPSDPRCCARRPETGTELPQRAAEVSASRPRPSQGLLLRARGVGPEGVQLLLLHVDVLACPGLAGGAGGVTRGRPGRVGR
ncbi:MAG: hypothetical protein J3K34DRAFT_419516 [Monoraphidium minutum]|nr:MAG: hypothetical protein J3K34DRAFT_419516 [Monoraphidium minutum]